MGNLSIFGLHSDVAKQHFSQTNITKHKVYHSIKLFANMIKVVQQSLVRLSEIKLKHEMSFVLIHIN